VRLSLGSAVAIKVTSPGPVFFCQKRNSYHNRLFLIFKFRTMYTHLGDRRGGACRTIDGDTRVTPIGRILRKTSLDELPQFLNVLICHMSIHWSGHAPHVPNTLAGGLL
jgi:lipopolysaccharide/colanic/teichoic acid biosynthesis glycosyltransferase